MLHCDHLGSFWRLKKWRTYLVVFHIDSFDCILQIFNNNLGLRHMLNSCFKISENLSFNILIKDKIMKKKECSWTYESPTTNLYSFLVYFLSFPGKQMLTRKKTAFKINWKRRKPITSIANSLHWGTGSIRIKVKKKKKKKKKKQKFQLSSVICSLHVSL